MTAFDSPLLISKAAWLYARPVDRRQRSLSVSELQLVSLLEKRRKKYLARKETIKSLEQKKPEHSDVNDQSARVLGDLEHCTVLGMHPRRHVQSRSPQLRFSPHKVGAPPSEVMSVLTKTKTRAKMSSQSEDSHKRCSPTESVMTTSSSQRDGATHCGSLLNRYGFSELAEHVVHRAKVRLKRRQKRNLPSLMSNDCDFQTRTPPLSCSPSKPMTTAATTKQRVKERTEEGALKNSEQRSRVSLIVTQQGAPSSKRIDISRSTAISNLGHQLQLMESVNTSSPSPMTTRSFKVVYWSDQQSLTPKETGVPNVPPVTPSYSYSQCFKFIPSLSDVKSQRQLRNRLQDIVTKLKQKSDLLNEDARTKEEEKRKQKEAVAKLKAQQRSEIYALNKIMAEFEEQKFQAFISGKV